MTRALARVIVSTAIVFAAIGSGGMVGLMAPAAHSADLATTLQTMQGFDRFIAAARSVDLLDELRDGGVYCSNGCTIFAPTDDAFADVVLPEDDQDARAIIQRHILPQEFRIGDIISRQGEALTYEFGYLPYSGLASRDLKVGGARVVRGDVDATNGVIHIVDEVLMP